MSGRTRQLVAVTLTIAVWLTSSGCAGGLCGRKLLRLGPAQSSANQVVADEGMYVVVARRDGPTKLVPIAGTTRGLVAGDAVGFRREGDGNVVALAKHFEMPVGKPDEGTRYLAWLRVDQRDAVRSDVGGRIGDAVLTTLTVVGVLATVVGLKMLVPDRRCDQCERAHHRSRPCKRN